jgi:hypothetical protein
MRHLTARASIGSVGEEIEDSNEEYVVAAERNFMWRTRPLNGQFEKVLKADCPHYPFPIKLKLRDCTMMKRFKSSTEALPGGDELRRNPRSGGMVLGEVEVTTITGWPRPSTESAMWLAGARANLDNGGTNKILPTLYAFPHGSRKQGRQAEIGKWEIRQVPKIYYTKIKQEKQHVIVGKHWW